MNNPVPETAFDQNKQRMRMGTGAADLIYGSGVNSHHYIDSLERFQKDFATVDKHKREQERLRKEAEIQKRRLEQLERQSRRWESVESQLQKDKQRREAHLQDQIAGRRRTANNNGLPFNPINLEYDRNPEGEKLKYRDEDHRIRGFVRAHNMDNKGNSKYNPLTGQVRIGIEKLVPDYLNDRFGTKLDEHYEGFKLIPPSSSGSVARRKQEY